MTSALIRKPLKHSMVAAMVMVMVMSMTASKALQAGAQDIAAIETLVESVGLLADRGDFAALATLYADEVQVDYRSLTGLAAELKSPEALMREWASVLPGFDRTRHAISDIQVEMAQSRAVATARVTADHFLDGGVWRVMGDYRFELHRQEDEWRISAHTLNLTEETGSRSLLEAAAQAAAENPPDFIIRQQTRDAVYRFLTALEDKDMTRFAEVWAEDAVQDMPFSPDGFPKRVSGRNRLIAHYSQWPEISGQADFTSNLRFYPLADPTMVFVEYTGSVDIIPTGRHYRQTYGGLFHVLDGKIQLFREYYDPTAFVHAFGLDEEDSAQ